MLRNSLLGFLLYTLLSLPSQASQGAGGPTGANDDCLMRAANYHGVNHWVLRAILSVESNFDPSAIRRNKNGTLDVGAAQINSMHFPELARNGIAPSDLLNMCASSYVAAWHLKKMITSHGNTWYGIAAYHSTTPCWNHRYSTLVWNTLVGWGVQPGQRMKVPPRESCEKPSKNVAKKQEQRSSIVAFDQPEDSPK